MPITNNMKKNYEGLENAPDTYSVRIVKIETDSNNDRDLYLMTNMIEPTVEELGDLYFERQRVEDSFKYEKLYGGLEFIHPNSNMNTILLHIAGVIGYYNMMQLTLSKVSVTPAPNDDKEFVLNRKIGWEHTMSYFLNFMKTGELNYSFKKLLENTKNIIRVGRFAMRCSMQPANPHQRSGAIKKAKEANYNRLQKNKFENLALG